MSPKGPEGVEPIKIGSLLLYAVAPTKSEPRLALAYFYTLLLVAELAGRLFGIEQLIVSVNVNPSQEVSSGEGA